MLPANAEGGTRQVSQEFPCNPEASLCLSVLQGCRKERAWRGLWPPWHAAAWHGGCPPQSLLVATSPECCRPAQQPRPAAEPAMQASVPSHALITSWFFLQYVYLLVRSYSIHSTSQKRIRAGKNLNADLKVGFMQGDLLLNGNSGIMCFVASLDLPS